MVMKWTAACLVAVALFGWVCDAGYADPQYGYDPSPGKPQVTPPRYQPPAPPPPQKASKQVPQDPTQSKQTFERTLAWRYPEEEKPVTPPDVPFELRHPVPAVTVAVECRERDAHVEVKKDMFGTGQLINAADLTLGTCAAVGEDNAAQVIIYEAQLQDCDSRLVMTEDALIYSFVLRYNPRPLGGAPVVRTSDAAIIVECHYPRKHNVSSLALDPLWIPFSATKVSEELLYFTLTLMTADWQYERPVYQYFLGDLINIQATVRQFFHVPLRVYIDSCVATIAPEMNSNPRYQFIERNGCLVDGRLTGSSSRFLPRGEDRTLQLQMEAFRFQGAQSGLMYITCHLKATSAGYPIGPEHRACSYLNGWKEASGVDAACGSCDSAGMGVSSDIGAGSKTGSNFGYNAGSSSLHTGSNVGSTGSYGGGSTGSYGGGSTGSYGGGSTGSYGGGSNVGADPGNYGGYTSPVVYDRKVRDVSQTKSEVVAEWEGDVTLGPIFIGEKTA
ncbi:zona pellucida sperm-binding protein 3-like [Diretmus argenteus]